MRCRKRASCSSVSSKSVYAVCTPVYRRHATVIKTGLAFDRLGKPTRWRLPLEGEDGLNRSGRSTRRQREFDPSPIDVDYVSGGPHRRAVRCLDVLLPPPEGARSGAGHTKETGRSAEAGRESNLRIGRDQVHHLQYQYLCPEARRHDSTLLRGGQRNQREAGPAALGATKAVLSTLFGHRAEEDDDLHDYSVECQGREPVAIADLTGGIGPERSGCKIEGNDFVQTDRRHFEL